MTFDPTVDYPLGSRRPDLVETPSGLALDEVTLEAAQAGTLVAADLRATAATLARQAAVARAAGRRQLADNLERAAELAGVPELEGGVAPWPPPLATGRFRDTLRPCGVAWCHSPSSAWGHCLLPAAAAAAT